MITAAQIKKFAPGAKAELVDAIIDNWPIAQAAGIERADKPDRLRYFMASIAVETGGIKSISENLNYTSAQRIYDIFKGPKSKPRFANVKACEPYVRNPKKLAIKVYGGRLGNAAVPSEDGWVYRGAGMMQTTGRDNFRAMGFEDNPDALRDPTTAFETAVREWTRRKCSVLADKGDAAGVRKAINGGLNGYDEFLAYYQKAKRVWPSVDGEPASGGDEIEREYTRPSGHDDDPEVVAPVPLPRQRETYTDSATVLRVQTQLRDLGYTEVGEPDGKMGKMTRAAILAFRDENDLPLTPTIDDELITALAAAKPRVLSTDRIEATPAEVREQVPEVKANWLSKLWGWFLGGGAAAGAGLTGAGEADPDKRGIFRTILGYIQDVPPWFWFALILVIAAAIIYVNHKGEKNGIAAFKEGARR